MPHRVSTSRTTAQTADERGPHSPRMPRSQRPGLSAMRFAGANLDSLNPPPPPKIEPYKTHLAYVKERRTDKEAADILTEALQALRARRERGEVIY